MRKKRRTAAQKRATQKLVALNKRRARASKAPARRRTAAGKAPVRRSNPIRRSVARKTPVRRRNPIKKGVVEQHIMPALIAGAGAVGLDAAWANLPIPASIKNGPFRHVAKAGAAVIGVELLKRSKVVKAKTADQLGTGALTVIAHQVITDLIKTNAPQINLGDDNMGYYDNGMGYYDTGMGYLSPALPSPQDNNFRSDAPLASNPELSYYGNSY